MLKESIYEGRSQLVFDDWHVTKRLELTVKYVDNMGKGPISSTLDSQNQDFLVGSIGYKF